MKFHPWVSTVAAVGLLLTLLAGCGGSGGDSKAASTAPKGDAAKGKVAFESTCISCHGQDGRGMVGLGKDLVNKSDWMKKQSDDALVALVKKGRTAADPENTTKVDMPPKGGNPAFTDEDIVNIVAYLRSIQK